jgi:peroxiredoxin
MVMKKPRIAAAIFAVLAGASCSTHGSSEPKLPNVALLDAQGAAVDLGQASQRATLTVLVFFSAHCHVLDEHEPRIRALYDAYAARGVQFFMIDSEVGGSPERDSAEAKKRAYPFPILVDRGAKLADALGAECSTFSAVVDATGHIRYRGGIDDDKTHLRETATPYLKDALDDLLAGRAPRVASSKALGCALEKW